MKKPFLWALFLILCGMGLFAGGAGGRTAAGGPQNRPGEADKPHAGTRLQWVMIPYHAQAPEHIELIELVRARTGIVIEPRIVPEFIDGQVERVLVNLMAGEEIDIFYHATPNLKKYYNAGVLSDVGELAANAGYDIKKIYGDYLPVFGGRVYGLPAFSDIWLTVYNKSMFDQAGIPYPAAEGWTWEKYIDTAKKLSRPSQKIYGSLMLDYNTYNYMYAIQSGASHYNARGLSNYDDPAFSQSLEFFYALGNVHRIQPPITEFKVGAISWDAFFTQKAEYAMFVCGGWTLSYMAESSKAQFPRDWKFGILPMPYPEGKPPSTLMVPGCYAIPITGRHKDAALAAAAVMAENQYTLGYGRVPARRDLSEGEINDYIENNMLESYAADGISTAEIKAAWFDPRRIAYPEKLIGPGDAEINQIWVEEGLLYGQGQKGLDAAIEAVRGRSDQAIRESGEK